MTERTSREHAEELRAMSTERFTGYHDAVERMARNYIALLDEHERLRGALAFYADLETWRYQGHSNDPRSITAPPIDLDNGRRARAALEPEAQP